MGKKRDKCKHGYSPVYMSGCAKCVRLAMGGLGILRDNDMDAAELLMLISSCFKTQEELDAAKVKAKQRVAELRRDAEKEAQ